jgi:Fur family transcriptional regulator, peroxide stress response regulator
LLPESITKPGVASQSRLCPVGVTVKDPDTLTALFRRHGLRVTPQRQCIFDILYDNRAHSTAEEIYGIAKGRMPTISLKTVYETLHSLAALGEIQQIDLGTGSIRFDSDVHHHHHLVCSSCDRIENIDLDLGPLTSSAAQRHGFVLGHTEVIVRGLCPNCVGPAGGSDHPYDQEPGGDQEDAEAELADEIGSGDRQGEAGGGHLDRRAG